MTPVDISNVEELAIYQGAKWEHVLNFTQTAGGDPVVLTGKTFVITVKKTNAAKTLLFHGTATVTDAENGQVTVSFDAADTDALSIGQVHVGMRDNLNAPYMEGTLPVKYFTPDPA